MVARKIEEQRPDDVCLTEAQLGWLSDRGGEVVASEPLPASHRMRRYTVGRSCCGRRGGGVPLIASGPTTSATSPGLWPRRRRPLADRCESSASSSRIRGSNPAHGSRDRKPWDDHRRCLASLREILGGRRLPTVVVGDFNQRHPFDPDYMVPEELYEELLGLFG
jgi:hypothetical protein